MPMPPLKFSNCRAGGGFTTSITRKRMKPRISEVALSGMAIMVTIIPAISSATISPGSLRPVDLATMSAAIMERTVTTRTAASCQGRLRYDMPQTKRSPTALPAVPGAKGE
jgi:hypothetical protein